MRYALIKLAQFTVLNTLIHRKKHFDLAYGFVILIFIESIKIDAYEKIDETIIVRAVKKSATYMRVVEIAVRKEKYGKQCRK